MSINLRWRAPKGLAPYQPKPPKTVSKALSGAFGDRRKRRAQLVARLKQRRRYGSPVRGGTKPAKPKSLTRLATQRRSGHFK